MQIHLLKKQPYGRHGVILLCLHLTSGNVCLSLSVFLGVVNISYAMPTSKAADDDACRTGTEEGGRSVGVRDLTVK